VFWRTRAVGHKPVQLIAGLMSARPLQHLNHLTRGTETLWRLQRVTGYAEIKIRLRLSDRAPALNLRPPRNIPLARDVLAVRSDATGQRAALMHRRLIPHLAACNARADGVAGKRTFRGTWRCLVAALSPTGRIAAGQIDRRVGNMRNDAPVNAYGCWRPRAAPYFGDGIPSARFLLPQPYPGPVAHAAGPSMPYICRMDCMCPPDYLITH
jgi:hypothetical protein